MHRRRAAGVALLLALATAGCGGSWRETPGTTEDAHPGGDPAASATGSTPPTTGAATDAATAADVLAEARDLVVSRAVIGFHAGLTGDGQLFQEVEGALVPGDGWEATSHLYDPGLEGGAGTFFVLYGDALWMQAEGWPEPSTGCWLHLPRGTAPVGLPALHTRVPWYVRLLGHLRATGMASETTVLAEIPLVAALALVPTKLHDQVDGLTVASLRTPVDVEVDVQSSGIREVRLRGDGLRSSLQAAAGSVSHDVGQALSHVDVTVSYPHAERPRLRNPAPSTVMEQGDRGCKAGEDLPA